MSLTVTFTKDATVVTLPAPTPGADAAVERLQSAGLTAGGDKYVYDAGIERYENTERFQNLTGAQKAALASFFTTVAGQQQTFTYIDSGGNSFTARFLNSVITFEKHSPESWDVETALELDAVGA